MRLSRLLLLATLAVLALPSFAQAADVPSNKTLYADGPSGRYLVDGQWLFRLDAAHIARPKAALHRVARRCVTGSAPR